MTVNVYHLSATSHQRRNEIAGILDNLHAQGSLENKREERHYVYALVELGDIHHNLQQERCERDARSKPKVG